MKKLFNTSFFYAILAMIFGVFYREFTKFNKFDTFSLNTTLSVIHTHFFILGMMFFLLLLLIERNYNITKHKKFNIFYNLYNIGLIIMGIMFLLRGVLQVLDKPITMAMSASISGIAGIGHILLGMGIVLFFIILKSNIKEN